jgi:hypothetical protein
MKVSEVKLIRKKRALGESDFNITFVKEHHDQREDTECHRPVKSLRLRSRPSNNEPSRIFTACESESYPTPPHIIVNEVSKESIDEEKRYECRFQEYLQHETRAKSYVRHGTADGSSSFSSNIEMVGCKIDDHENEGRGGKADS